MLWGCQWLQEVALYVLVRVCFEGAYLASRKENACPTAPPIHTPKRPLQNLKTPKDFSIACSAQKVKGLNMQRPFHASGKAKDDLHVPKDETGT